MKRPALFLLLLALASSAFAQVDIESRRTVLAEVNRLSPPAFCRLCFACRPPALSLPNGLTADWCRFRTSATH
jgi:hypothetical protein